MEEPNSSPTSVSGEHVLGIIAEEENEDESNGTESEGLSSHRPMFLQEKGERPSYIYELNPNLPIHTKEALLQTFGPFWASHFVNPNAPPYRNTAPDALKISFETASQDAKEMWDVLRSHSLRRLQYKDYKMGPKLRKSFGAYTRNVQFEDFEAQVPKGHKPLQRFFYWDSATGKDIPPQDIFPTDNTVKNRVAKRKKVSGFAHASSVANQNVSEMLLFNNQPPRYAEELEIYHDSTSRLLRHGDVEHNDQFLRTMRESVQSTYREKPFPKSESIASSRTGQQRGLVFAKERELDVSRPKFTEAFPTISSANRIPPPKPLISHVNNSAISSDKLFSVRAEEIEQLLKDSKASTESLTNRRKCSAPSMRQGEGTGGGRRRGWNPLTLSEIIDNINITSANAQQIKNKPLSAH